MALDKSALPELTEAPSSADDGQLMRKLLHTILQDLIDAEAPSTSAPIRTNAQTPEGRTATGPGTRPPPRPVGLDGEDRHDPPGVLLPVPETPRG
jgi:hypothetical protein